MSTTIRTDNRVDIEVCDLGVAVVNHEEQTETWARLTPDQRRALADALGADRGRQWIRDDVPSEVLCSHMDHDSFLCDEMREMLADHLNTHHPKPDASRIRNLEWEVAEHSDGARRAVNERDAMRRERDAAVARAEKAERERDEADRRTAAAEADRDRWKLNHDRVDGQWAKAEREVTKLRGAVERAEKAEKQVDIARDFQRTCQRERDEWESNAMGFEQQTIRLESERDEWRERAEKAEARTAPAVTRDEIEAAIQAGGDHAPDFCDCTEQETCESLADATAAVWYLLSGDDPAVFQIRQSEVDAMKVRRRAPGTLYGGPGAWETDNQDFLYSKGVTSEVLNDEIEANREGIVQALAVRQAIAAEAEQAVDPVEAEVAMAWAEYRKDYQPNPDDLTTAHKAFTSGYQAARHVLGPEADQ